jgi:hypothetical protein
MMIIALIAILNACKATKLSEAPTDSPIPPGTMRITQIATERPTTSSSSSLIIETIDFEELFFFILPFPDHWAYEDMIAYPPDPKDPSLLQHVYLGFGILGEVLSTYVEDGQVFTRAQSGGSGSIEVAVYNTTDAAESHWQMYLEMARESEGAGAAIQENPEIGQNGALLFFSDLWNLELIVFFRCDALVVVSYSESPLPDEIMDYVRILDLELQTRLCQ